MAADYDMTSKMVPWIVITALTSVVKKILLPKKCKVSILHMQVQDDGVTDSANTDYVVIMRDKDSDGVAVTMAANFNDGVKAPIYPGGSISFMSNTVSDGSDGSCEIQIKAVSHGAKLLIVKDSNL